MDYDNINCICVQLKTHKEDFEQERRDRVRIHEEKENLKQELESQAQVIKMLVCR